MNSKLFKLDYSGTWHGQTLMKFKIKNGKASMGVYRKNGQTYSESEVVPLTFTEPSVELFLSMLRLTSPSMEVRPESIKWQFIGQSE